MVPHYRLRLFLSVDMVGSTAYKFGAGRETGTEKGAGLEPQWLINTKKFYSSFTSDFQSQLSRLLPTLDIIPARTPKVWKTIGDEIVYVSSVNSVEEVSAFVSSFMASIFSYRETLNNRKIPLDVKGSGWIAAFPSPNTTLKLDSLGKSEDSMLTLPNYEVEADEDPVQFDFIGTEIDCGFRISRLATAALMPVTLELAAILAEAAIRSKFSTSLIYYGRQEMKGVLNDSPYPVIFLDTERRQSRRLVNSREDALLGRRHSKPEEVRDFVKAFMDDLDIQPPYFNGDPEFSRYPLAYEIYKKNQERQIEETKKEDRSREESIVQTADEDLLDTLPESVVQSLGLNTESDPHPSTEAVQQESLPSRP